MIDLGPYCRDEESHCGISASDPGSVICYRLEPTKRMLGRSRCDVLPSAGRLSSARDVPPCLLCNQTHTVINLEKACRVALMVTPQVGGDVVDQAWEAVSTMRAILKQQAGPMAVTSQTVFLSHAEHEEPCRKLFQAYFRERMPATNFVVQPPCGGQVLAIEAWALGGPAAEIHFRQPHVVTAAYDGLRWIHVGGISASGSPAGAYCQANHAFDETARSLEQAGASFGNVVRAWLYLGDITQSEHGTQRYRELNRARTDFFGEQEAAGWMAVHRGPFAFYPASTGIGTAGRGLTVSCLALQTLRSDVRLQPLENPQQTSAFDYAANYSAKSPKFSRAMAVVIGDYVTTWISGTASIANSESKYPGDVERQTEQTIDNIERLISRENFERHGVPETGAKLHDLAKIRVYVKRPADYEKCRAICQRRFGPLPMIFAHADICRPELLVEIEGVAFSRLRTTATSSPGGT